MAEGGKNNSSTFVRTGGIPRTPPKQEQIEKKRRTGDSEKDNILFDILEEIRGSRKDMNEIKTKISSIEEKMENMTGRMGEMEEEWRKRDEEGQRRMNEMEKNFDLLKKENEEMKRRWENLERSNKRLNIIIKGVREDNQHETKNQTKEIVQKLLGDRFSTDEGEIESAERLGRKFEGKNRNIIVKLGDMSEKIEILKKKKENLKNTNIFINEDLTKEERRIRGILLKRAKEERTSGNRATLRGNKLLINGTLYELKNDGIKEELTPMAKNYQNPMDVGRNI